MAKDKGKKGEVTVVDAEEEGTVEVLNLSPEMVRAQAEAEFLIRESYVFEDQVVQTKSTIDQSEFMAAKAVELGLEAGMRLRVIKDLSPKRFGKACEMIGIKARRASEFISLYCCFGIKVPKALEREGMMKMIELSYINDHLTDEEREELIEHGKLGGDDVHEVGYRAVQKIKTDLIKTRKQLEDTQGQVVSGRDLVKALEDENRRLKSAIPKNEEELLDQLEDCFSDVERLCSRLSQVNLNGIGPIGLTRYATFLEYMKTRPAKVLDLQMQRTAGLAEVDVMVAYTELQNAVVMERAMMAQREPKRARELEKASPLAARLNELEPEMSLDQSADHNA